MFWDQNPRVRRSRDGKSSQDGSILVKAGLPAAQVSFKAFSSRSSTCNSFAHWRR